MTLKKLAWVILSFILVLMTAAVLLTGPETLTGLNALWQQGMEKLGELLEGEPPITASQSQTESPFEIHVLDVGQGLSVLIAADGNYMLYDGGDRTASSFVVRYLKDLGVEHLERIVCSHYHDDHINGLVGVLYNFSCGEVLAPDYETDTKIYRSFCAALEQSTATLIHPKVGDTFALGNARVEVVSPARWDYEEENDRSIGVRVVYGEQGVLICGDAEGVAEEDMLRAGFELDADLFVVSHHGSSTSNGEGFVRAVSPRASCISCGADNEYGHPTRRTMDTLQRYGGSIYRTDKQGTVIFRSDGEQMWSDVSPTQELGAPEQEVPSSEEGQGAGYVCNTRSMKFHTPDCPGAETIGESNRLNSTLTREQLLDKGYEPCGMCRP